MHIGRSVPNLLTAVRLLLTPWLAWAILRHEFRLALWIFVAVAVTDGLDGWIARRFHSITRFGAILDPIADKIFLSTVYLCLGLAGAIPIWLVYVVFGRDAFILLMAGAGLLLTPLRDFPPSIWGKLSTIVQVACATTVLVWQAGFMKELAALIPVLIALVTVMAFWSGLHYLISGIRRVRAVDGGASGG
jgi:cardiolipin synthase (CMP-forming)